MTHTVVFDRVGNGYTVRFPYDALLVDLLKSRVRPTRAPGSARASTGPWTAPTRPPSPPHSPNWDAPWSALKLAPRRRVTVGRSTCSVRSARHASLLCTVHFRKCCTPTSPQAAAFCNANSMMLERNWRTSHDRSASARQCVAVRQRNKHTKDDM